MGKFRAYNKLYEDGKPKGHAFVVGNSKAGEDRVVFVRRMKRDNTRWNNLHKDGVTTKLVKVIVVKKAPKKKRQNSNPFNFEMPKFRGF